MNISNSNIPKQARALITGPAKVATYETSGGEVTAQFAQHNLTLIPPIAAGSIIHDNACGSGTVSRAILSSSPKDVKIYAADIDQPFLDKLSEDVQKNSWNIDVSNQRSEELNFADDFFDLSVTNIGIFFFKNAGLDGAKQIHRTLKPGGTAIVNCWQHVTWQPAIFAVHKKFRSEHPFPAPTINWSDGQQLQNVLTEAGFAKEAMKVERHEAWVKIGGGDEGFRKWCEKSWAYLAGIAGWFPEDEGRWEEEVDMMVSVLKGLGEEKGVKIVGDEVQLMASQWVVVVKK
ncbi:S-adenosyl-L-methionine-dependent methyltransferase [Byssothecium circinans]|uniref:S-adenosyl-L-methionine-dependent methyltransferase n=1 Tax=Byssothecium circinans TaxID=147558 RepID=A0A6A5TZV1_9PLEO|nr:S-adenosyl-L-methionine-dependent methyltransferase [Byssothecium circinans]